MSHIKQFISEHKRIVSVVIGCTLGLLLGMLSAYLVAHVMNKGQVEVPPGLLHDTGVFGEDIVVHDSTGGPVIISLATSDDDEEAQMIEAMKLITDPDAIWTETTYSGNYTMIDTVKQLDGSIGVLAIDKLGLSVNVYDSGDESMMADMAKGVAHFPSTSTWDGCVAMSAHNINFDGSAGYFKNLYTLSKGDTIRYSTKLGERSYSVTSIDTISDSDWTPTYHTDHNQIVLITCITGKPNNRLCVTAVEAAS